MWCYNLNYFDFLNQEIINFELEKSIIFEWNKGFYKSKNIVWDPYPVSMRIVNLIKWFSVNHSKLKVNEQNIILSLIKRNDLFLRNNIEFQIGGNHLLENYISLLISSIFFNTSNKIKIDFMNLNNEIANQFLGDSFHFERSIMYHNLLVEKLLDVISIIRKVELSNDIVNQFNILKQNISKMLVVTKNFSFPEFIYPSFNDVIRNKYKRVPKILKYAKNLNFSSTEKKDCLNFQDSGYIKYKFENLVFIYDYGDTAPKHIPGHGHCDCFSFEFFHKNTPLLVNTGTSTYDYGDRRLSERSSSSHNTLSFENKNQDEIWSRFRIARQHKVDYFDLYEFDKGNLSMKGMLTNYDKSYKHIRKVNIKKQFIDIIDEFESSKKGILPKINLHFHPNVKIDRKSKNTFSLNNKLILKLKNFEEVNLKNYNYAESYGKLIESLKIEAIMLHKKLKFFFHLLNNLILYRIIFGPKQMLPQLEPTNIAVNGSRVE